MAFPSLWAGVTRTIERVRVAWGGVRQCGSALCQNPRPQSAGREPRPYPTKQRAPARFLQTMLAPAHLPSVRPDRDGFNPGLEQEGQGGLLGAPGFVARTVMVDQ